MQKPQYRKNSSHLVISHEKYSEVRFHEWEHFTYPKFANITECIHFTITPCTNVFTQLLMSFCSAFKFSFGVDWRNSGSKRSLSGEISEQLSFCSIKKPLNEVHICLLSHALPSHHIPLVCSLQICKDVMCLPTQPCYGGVERGDVIKCWANVVEFGFPNLR